MWRWNTREREREMFFLKKLIFFGSIKQRHMIRMSREDVDQIVYATYDKFTC